MSCSVIVHLTAWRQGLSLNLDLGLRLASPVVLLGVNRCVCPTAGILGGFRDLNSGPQALVTAKPSSAPLLTLFH